MIRRRYPPTSNSSTRSALHDSSSSEDEEDQLLREEREQERLLSEQHGEANEDITSTSNKRQSDADIANALNSTSAVKKKKPRMTLTGSHLIGPEGLIRIRHDFSNIKYRNPKPVMAKKDRKVAKKKQFDREIHASAVYTARMMQAYQEFALDLAPNMHYNDTFIKIRDMGSKKEVKDYLNEMRQEVCKGHLEKIYGKDKAEKFVDEFENGMQSRGVEVEDKYANDQDYGAGIAQRLATLEASQDKEDDDNVQVNGNSAAKLPLVRKDNDDGDDDENEALFDDVAPSQAVAGNKDQEDTISAVAAEDLQVPTNDENQSNSENEFEEPHGDDDELEELHEVDNELEEPNGDDLEEPRADDNSLEEPRAGGVLEKLEESTKSELPAARDDKEDSSPITQDPELNNTEIVEFSQSQASAFGEGHGQENVSMTQDTMVFDASQTQEATQDTLIVDASQTQMTAETLVFDSSQDLNETQEGKEESSSQDY